MRIQRILLLALVFGSAGGVAEAAGDVRKGLQSIDPVESYAAAADALSMKDPTLAGPLIEAGWQTAFPHVAAACGEALAALGDKPVQDADYQRVLQKAQKTKDARGLENLARVLGAYGDKSVDDVLSWLASSHRGPDVQIEALFQIGRLKPTAAAPFPKCLEVVETALKSPKGSVQMAAASAASRLKDPRYTEPLVDIARKSTHPYAGLYAVWALLQMGAQPGVGPFIHVAESDAKRETVDACLKAIVWLSGPEDVEALLSLSRSSKKDNRDAACLALGLIVERAKGGIAELGAPTTPKDGSPPAAGAAPAAGGAGARVIERMLQVVASDGDWEVRDAARQTLLRIGEPARDAVAAACPKLIDMPERDVELTAIELCGEFRVEAAAKPLQKMALQDKDPVKRMFAARALGLINPQQAAADLLAGAKKDAKSKRMETVNQIRAAGYVRSEQAYKGLLEIASGDGSELILRETERSLERLTGRRFGRRAERWNLWYEKAKDKDPFRPHLPKVDRSKNRREAIDKKLFGLTEATERAVENGLRWLEQQQHGEGLWDGAEKGFGGVTNCLPAYTGLCLLSFLGAGYESGHGKYGETIRRGVEFLAATQFYDGGFPVTGGGDNSWIFAYLIALGNWAITEAYAIGGDAALKAPAQRGVDYLVRAQTPGEGWRYGPRNQTDSSCTAWVLMTLKAANVAGLRIAQKSYDSIDSWYERAQSDITGEEEKPEDMTTEYDKEVGSKRYFKAITGYFVLSGSSQTSLQQTSMTAVGMVCRFFLGWHRSHPFQIGSANYLMDYLPQWRKGLEKGQAIAWYFYFWYYGTLAMHQMGGRYWRAWNDKIRAMLPENQRNDPPALAGSWDPDTAVLNGGRLFSTSLAIMSLETYYRFSPLIGDVEPDKAGKPAGAGGAVGAGMDGAGMDGAGMDGPAMGDAPMDEPPMDGDGMSEPAMGDAPMDGDGMSEPAMGDAPMDEPPMDGGDAPMDGDGMAEPAMDDAPMDGAK